MRTAAYTQLDFREAATAWLQTRRLHIAPRTFLDYSNYIKTLSIFFAEMRPQEITPDMVRAYQQQRRLYAGPGSINKECGILIQVRARMGMPIADYQPLRVPKDWESPGKRLTDIEEARLERVLRAGADHPLWDVAALASLLSMKCGAGPGEVLSLRLKDCRLQPAEITIPPGGAKNVRRERLITLNDGAGWALERLIARAHTKCGCFAPEHQLIPFRRRDHSYDPTRPATGYREGLRQLLGIADVRMRRYDFRHHAISRALDNPKVSIEGAKAYFGWISPRMIRKYYHGNVATLRVVAAAMDRKPARSVFDPRVTFRDRIRK